MTAQGEGILAWLDGAVTRRERVAQAAAALQADPENGWGIVDDSGYAVPSKRRTISPHIGITHEPESAEHIVLNNPADVLRRCAADRKTLALYAETVAIRDRSAASLQTAQDRGDMPDPCVLDDWSRANRETAFMLPLIQILADGYGWTAGQTPPSEGDQVT
jgi:hypothetical protein